VVASGTSSDFSFAIKGSFGFSNIGDKARNFKCPIPALQIALVARSSNLTGHNRRLRKALSDLIYGSDIDQSKRTYIPELLLQSCLGRLRVDNELQGIITAARELVETKEHMPQLQSSLLQLGVADKFANTTNPAAVKYLEAPQ
jgi:hypothetical protein